MADDAQPEPVASASSTTAKPVGHITAQIKPSQQNDSTTHPPILASNTAVNSSPRLVTSAASPGGNLAESRDHITVQIDPPQHNDFTVNSSNLANNTTTSTLLEPVASAASAGAIPANNHISTQSKSENQVVSTSPNETTDLGCLVAYVEHIAGRTPEQSTGRDMLGFQSILEADMPSNVDSAAGQSLRLFIVQELWDIHAKLLAERFDIDYQFFEEHFSLFGNPRSGRELFAPELRLTEARKSLRWFQLQGVEPESPWGGGRHWVVPRVCDAAIWIGQDPNWQNTTIGIVLSNAGAHSHPKESIKEWKTISLNEAASYPCLGSHTYFSGYTSDTRHSLFRNIHQLTASFPWSGSREPLRSIDRRIFVLPTLYAVCAKTFEVCNVIRNHLNHLETENFEISERDIEWSRKLPFYLEAVNATLDEAIPDAIRLTVDPGSPDTDDLFANIVKDFTRAQTSFHSFQARIDRLQAKEVASQQLAAANQSLAESHNLARLTWLAAIFIPMTFVSGLFSMTENVGGLTDKEHSAELAINDPISISLEVIGYEPKHNGG
ncbi:hypothetical protein DM02DRAFT_676713 [Periconia macrospinosa]|uniref:Uncharacterized protein n=1 Tax=Periconia macrospinosa TaxID=97972 RepID=A0A2V1D8Z0_9PLEO|nr:hypothetical protein DM02DRAFT_676713 [Periconia macrospinosa]